MKKLARGAKWLLGALTAAMLLLIVLAAYTNVPTAVTPDDRAVFEQIGLRSETFARSFDQEVELIKKIQHEIFKRAPLSPDGIPEYEPREPSDLMRHGKGLCYDRSRTFDKAFHFVGLPSRHVYLLYQENRSFLGALFHHGQSSHAVTEVKTSKGWMFVDSNTEWVAITKNGEPVGADDVWRRYSDFAHAPKYLSRPWWAIRGMYSRKGQFYGAGLPFPELNWHDFTFWLLNE